MRIVLSLGLIATLSGSAYAQNNVGRQTLPGSIAPKEARGAGSTITGTSTVSPALGTGLVDGATLGLRPRQHPQKDKPNTNKRRQ